MIYNIGIRTDIVSFYTSWLINRLDDEFVHVRNPYSYEVYEYDLNPENVDCLFFCSKNYESLLKYLPDIITRYNTHFFYTITAYGSDVESNIPSIDKSIDTLIQLSEIVGEKRVSWRYDPVLFTDKYDVDYHIKCYEYIASQINNNINNSIFSFVDTYDKLNKNMPEILPFKKEETHRLLTHLGKISKKHNISIQSCATKKDYATYSIRKSGCITKKLLTNTNNLNFKNIKQEGIRKNCKCIKTYDIGAYNTCPGGCKYCYANKNTKIAKINYKRHDDKSTILKGKITKKDKIKKIKPKSLLYDKAQQKLI